MLWHIQGVWSYLFSLITVFRVMFFVSYRKTEKEAYLNQFFLFEIKIVLYNLINNYINYFVRLVD